MKFNITNYKKSVLIGFGIVFILLFLGPIFLFPYFGDYSKSYTELFVFSRFYYWFCLFLLLLFVTKIEKQKLLLWKNVDLSVLDYLKHIFVTYWSLIGVVMVVSIILSILKLNHESENLKSLSKIFTNNKPLIIMTCITAGVTEELFFRGYLIPRLHLFTKHKYLPLVLSSAFFGLLHIGYGTIAQVVGPFFIGLVFAFYYQRFRNIHVIIICHFLWDWMALYIHTTYVK